MLNLHCRTNSGIGGGDHASATVQAGACCEKDIDVNSIGIAGAHASA